MNTIDASTLLNVEFMYASRKYDFHEIDKLCTEQLVAKISRHNVLQYLQVAIDFQCKVIQERCLEVFASRTKDILASEDFLNITQEALCLLMSSAEVTGSSEVDMFLACRNWARTQCRRCHITVASGSDIREVLGEVMGCLCYSDFQLQEVKFTRDILDPDDTMELLQHLSLVENLRAECELTLQVGQRQAPRVRRDIPGPPPTHRLSRIRSANSPIAIIIYIICPGDLFSHPLSNN